MDKEEIRKKIISEITKTEERIENYRELTKPIEPDVSLGRLTRMDAINNKGVAEYALRQAEEKLDKLRAVSSKIDSPEFGICRKCNTAIRFERLLHIPESVFCVRCTP